MTAVELSTWNTLMINKRHVLIGSVLVNWVIVATINWRGQRAFVNKKE
jgi:hypothetical protein